MTVLPPLPARYRSRAADRSVDLPSTRLQQLRVGGIAMIGDSGIQSGIDKHGIDVPVWLGPNGFDGDKQRETFHGGSDRAVLQYSADHYPQWTEEFPGSADRFVAGGFGENFVATGMDESTMCIGDVVMVGEAILQVAESRQPCFKLNHRFGQPTMARRVQESGRTGWLYRVLTPGYVQAGDEIRVVERPLPEWTVLHLQHYLYGDTDDISMAEFLADLPYLSKAQSALLRTRVDNAGEVEDWDGRLSNGSIGDTGLRWVSARIDDIVEETPDIKSFAFRREDGTLWPDLPAGGHVRIKVDNTLTRSYSLTTTRDRSRVRIAIARAPRSAGGSAYMHATAAVGDEITVTEPQDSFPIAEVGGTHVLLASGIGITPFTSMIEVLEERGADWELHYCVRTYEAAAFHQRLTEQFGDRVHMHVTNGDSSRRLDLVALLRNSGDKHVYCCGSPSFLRSVRAATEHWPAGTVHFESFESLATGRTNNPFSAHISSTGATIEVDENTSLLTALRAAGVNVESSCETGTCGTCKVRYSVGDIEHRDMVLSRAERERTMISCVSRARGEVELEI